MLKKSLIGIKPSNTRNLIFLVYRSTNQLSLSVNTDELLEQSPIAIINEKNAKVGVNNIKDLIINRDLEIISNIENTIPYTVDYDIVKDLSHNLILTIQYNTDEISKFYITFNNDGTINEILKDKLLEEQSNTILSITSNTLYLHKDIVKSAVKVSIDYYTEVIEFEDCANEQAGIEYIGSEIGLIKPITLTSSKTVNKINVPILEFKATSPLEEVAYYYRVLAKDEYGNVSEPSNISVKNINQQIDKIINILECCNYEAGVNINEQRWESTDNNIVVNDQTGVIPFNEKEYMFIDDNERYKHKIDINSVEISYIYNPLSQTHKSVCIKIPYIFNIHHSIIESKYNKRKTKAFRIKTQSETIDNYISYSNTIMPETIDVYIEKLIIYKSKEQYKIDEMNINEINFENNFAVVAKFVKKDGLYYEKDNILNSEEVNNNKITDSNLINIVDIKEDMNTTMTILDSDVEENEIYYYYILVTDIYKITTCTTISVVCK